MVHLSRPGLGLIIACRALSLPVHYQAKQSPANGICEWPIYV
jgi:hypothetical protein